MKMLVAAAIAAATLATPAFAQLTDSTTITATIPLICSIDAPAGGAVVIGTSTVIGDSSATCNDPDGFTATLTSANLGVMKGQANNATVIPYTLSIAGVGTFDLATAQTVPGAANAGLVGPFATSIDAGAASGPSYADSYTDVITYAIAPN